MIIKSKLKILIGILISIVLSCKTEGSNKDKTGYKKQKENLVHLEVQSKPNEMETEVSAEEIPNEYKVKILMNEDPPEDEFANLQWYGIFTKEDSSEIRKVKISIKKYHHPIFDSDLPEESEDVSGRELVVMEKEKPLFLVSGVKGIQEKKISSVKIKETKILDRYKDNFEYTSVIAFIKPTEELNVSYNDDNIKFTAEGNLENFNKDYITLDEPYRLFVSSENGKRQLINEVESFELESQIYGFTWFGDLDNDGKIDVLMSISNHYAVRAHALFLSSYAEKDEVMKDVVTYGYSID